MLSSASLRPVADSSEVAKFGAFLRSRYGDLKEAFKALDAESRGFLTVDELVRGTERMDYAGFPVSLFHALDRDFTGMISLRTFVTSVEDGMLASDDSSSLQSAIPSFPRSSGNPSIDEMAPLEIFDMKMSRGPLFVNKRDNTFWRAGTCGSAGTATTRSSARLTEVIGSSISGKDDAECTRRSCVSLDDAAAAVRATASVHERLASVEEQLSNERALRLEAEQRLFQRVSDMVGTVVLQQLQAMGFVHGSKVAAQEHISDAGEAHADASEHDGEALDQLNRCSAEAERQIEMFAGHTEPFQQPARQISTDSEEAPPAIDCSLESTIAAVRDDMKSLGRRVEESQRRMDMLEVRVRGCFLELLAEQRKAPIADAGRKPCATDDGKSCGGAADASWLAPLRCRASGNSFLVKGEEDPLHAKAGAEAEAEPRHALAKLGVALAACETARMFRNHSADSFDGRRKPSAGSPDGPGL